MAGKQNYCGQLFPTQLCNSRDNQMIPQSARRCVLTEVENDHFEIISITAPVNISGKYERRIEITVDFYWFISDPLVSIIFAWIYTHTRM